MTRRIRSIDPSAFDPSVRKVRCHSCRQERVPTDMGRLGAGVYCHPRASRDMAIDTCYTRAAFVRRSAVGTIGAPPMPLEPT